MTRDTTVYEGTLVSCDQTMNLIISPIKIKSKTENGTVKTVEHDSIYVRGEDVSFVSPSLEGAALVVPKYDPLQPD